MPSDGYEYGGGEFEEEDNESQFGSSKVQQTGGVAPGKQGGGTGFVNLGQILGVNKQSGLAQADKMTGDINEKGRSTLTKLGGMENAFNAQATAQEQATSTKDVRNSKDAGERATVAEAGYVGPANLAGAKGWDDAAKSAYEVSQDANAIGSDSGRAGLLMGQGLSGGESAYDMFTMGMNNPKFAQTKNEFSGLRSMLGNFESRTGARADAASKKMAGNVGALRGMRSQMAVEESAQENADERELRDRIKKGNKPISQQGRGAKNNNVDE